MPESTLLAGRGISPDPRPTAPRAPAPGRPRTAGTGRVAEASPGRAPTGAPWPGGPAAAPLDAPALGALVRCARDGDPQAFRSVAEQLAPPLLRFVMRFTGQGTDFATDVVQDALVAAWCNLDSIRDDGHIRPWLFRVARCKAVDRLRRRGPRGIAALSLDVGIEQNAEPVAPPATDPAVGGGGDGVLREEVEAGILALPAHYVGVVRLHYLHGFTVAETAHLLGLPKPAVRMRLHRARKRLRRLLWPLRGRPGPAGAQRRQAKTREGDGNGPNET